MSKDELKSSIYCLIATIQYGVQKTPIQNGKLPSDTMSIYDI